MGQNKLKNKNISAVFAKFCELKTNATSESVVKLSSEWD